MAKTGKDITISNISYHYAHIKNFFKSYSTVRIIDQDQGIIRIFDNISGFYMGERGFFVKFAPYNIKALFSGIQEVPYEGTKVTKSNFTLDVDTYSGIVAIKYSILRAETNPASTDGQMRMIDNDPYIYDDSLGYIQSIRKTMYSGRGDLGIGPQFTWLNNYKPESDFGYIVEVVPRIVEHLLTKSITVENIQKGILKIHTSSFDTRGYISQLSSEAILEITQTLDSAMAMSLEEQAKEKPEATQLMSQRLDQIKYNYSIINSSHHNFNYIDLDSIIKEFIVNESPIDLIGIIMDYCGIE